MNAKDVELWLQESVDLVANPEIVLIDANRTHYTITQLGEPLGDTRQVIHIVEEPKSD